MIKGSWTSWTSWDASIGKDGKKNVPPASHVEKWRVIRGGFRPLV